MSISRVKEEFEHIEDQFLGFEIEILSRQFKDLKDQLQYLKILI